MSIYLGETPFGRMLNTLSNGRLLPLPDQVPGWQLPGTLFGDNIKEQHQTYNSSKDQTLEQQLSRYASRVLPEGQDLSLAESISRAPQFPRAPTLLHSQSTLEKSAEPIVVEWYDELDPENPKNWTLKRKLAVTFSICFLTFSVYAGSSIVTPSIPGLIEEFGVSEVQGTLTLSVFIIGYAIGPLFLAPPSDVPSIGRSHPYWMSMLALVLFNVGAAHTDSYAAVIVLRLLSGMAGSPALATGGATLGDVWDSLALPKAISIWAIGAVAGPVLGPVIAGWAAQNVSWRLPYYIFVALSGIGLIITVFFLPETLPANILYRRAARLRKLTGEDRYKSQGEMDQAAVPAARFMLHSLWMPIRISFEPIVLYSSILLGLTYAIFYLAFEATPIIYGQYHGFNLGEQTLPYLGLGVNAFFFTLPFYLLYLIYYFDPRFMQNLERGIIKPEDRIILSMIAAPIVIISLLWTGWTSSPSISYWSPLVAMSLYLTPVFLLFQSVLVYLSFTYPEHAASVLSANDLIRSLIASVFPLFARPMFDLLGLGKSYTLLAGLSLALLVPLFGLYRYGYVLRRISKYAQNYDRDLSLTTQA